MAPERTAVLACPPAANSRSPSDSDIRTSSDRSGVHRQAPATDDASPTLAASTERATQNYPSGDASEERRTAHGARPVTAVGGLCDRGRGPADLP